MHLNWLGSCFLGAPEGRRLSYDGRTPNIVGAQRRIDFSAAALRAYRPRFSFRGTQVCPRHWEDLFTDPIRGSVDSNRLVGKHVCRPRAHALSGRNEAVINRRNFAKSVGVAATAGVAACSMGPHTARSTTAGPTSAPPTAFGSLKHINAGLLNVGYAEDGPTDGPPVILLHGWPYDIYSYLDVVPLLAAKGYRVLVPYLRGFGNTQFLSNSTFRNGQQAALATDVIDFMDALKIGTAVIGGFDWGARSADIVAAMWPQRTKALVSVSGYLIVNLEANQQPLSPQAELGWWYQYYFATDRGRRGYQQNTYEFNELIWRTASPTWNFDAATYARTAAAFSNPDHVDVVVHNYRWRLGLAQGESRYDDLDAKLKPSPPITVPTITIGTDFDGPAKSGVAYRQRFTGKYDHLTLDGVGHNVPQEAPEAFAGAVIRADNL
jgi:pimeloyl-ACP methyl ester carboxylesterase